MSCAGYVFLVNITKLLQDRTGSKFTPLESKILQTHSVRWTIFECLNAFISTVLVVGPNDYIEFLHFRSTIAFLMDELTCSKPLFLGPIVNLWEAKHLAEWDQKLYQHCIGTDFAENELEMFKSYNYPKAHWWFYPVQLQTLFTHDDDIAK